MKQTGEISMKTLKGWITTTCLAVTLVFSAMPVNAGIIVGGRTISDDTCKETAKVDSAGGIIVGGFTGIIVGGLTGIIVGGLTGIIVGGPADTPTVNCGIIVGG
jgi:hypothetical protein